MTLLLLFLVAVVSSAAFFDGASAVQLPSRFLSTDAAAQGVIKSNCVSPSHFASEVSVCDISYYVYRPCMNVSDCWNTVLDDKSIFLDSDTKAGMMKDELRDLLLVNGIQEVEQILEYCMGLICGIYFPKCNREKTAPLQLCRRSCIECYKLLPDERGLQTKEHLCHADSIMGMGHVKMMDSFPCTSMASLADVTTSVVWMTVLFMSALVL